MEVAKHDLQWFGSAVSRTTIFEGELVAVTGDDSDAPQLEALVPVLKRLRGAFGMEMVFIGELRNGRLTGRHVPPDEPCNPFEEAYGRGLLKSRCGSSQFDAISVCSPEGIESGTLVCGAPVGDGYQPPPDSLKSVSRLLASSMRRMTST